MRVVITGGGTGGHLSVARAFLDEFIARGYPCIFIGSNNGADRIYFQNEEHLKEKWFLETSGVVDKRGIGLLKALCKQGYALRKAYRILRDFKPSFVLSVGGYSAAPAAFGACVLGIPLIIHEQNAKIGRLNQILKPFAKFFFSSYLESSPIQFYPVREVFFQTARVRNGIKNMLLMGGSQGARGINAFGVSVALELKKRGIVVFHQSGTRDFVRLVGEYVDLGLRVGILEDCFRGFKESLGEESGGLLECVCCVSLDCVRDVDVVVFSFSLSMPSVYALCDFAVCRAGASSLWELCANGLPALFVPYPYAASNHQYYNAKFIEENGLGFLCLEKDLTANVLWECLERLKESLSTLSIQLQEKCSKEAVGAMCAMIISSVRGEKEK